VAISSDRAKPATAKPRKPIAAKAAAVIDTPAPVTGDVPVPPEADRAQRAEMIEAVASPAVESDPISGPAVIAAPINEGFADMATASHTDTADKAQALFGDFSNRFKTAFEKSSKLNEEIVDFAKGNVEAVIASARVAAKAGETLGQQAAEYGKKNFEAATTAFKGFTTAKSPTDLFQLQSEFAKAQFDSVVAEASKISESFLKIAGEIAQPLSNRYAIAAEKFKSQAL